MNFAHAELVTKATPLDCRATQVTALYKLSVTVPCWALH